MQSSVDPPTHLRSLTGLRGVAAYAVLTAHAMDMSFNYGGAIPFHPFASRLAYFGMSLFFVMSGFVIHYNYADLFGSQTVGTAARSFFLARFARLYPLYALSLIMSVTHIPSAMFNGDPVVASAYLTLTQSWFNMEMSVFPPDWSISTEWFFYFAFVPLVFLVVRLRNPVRVLAVYGLVVPIVLALVLRYGSDSLGIMVRHVFWWSDQASAAPLAWLPYFSPYIRLLEFVCGMLACQAYRSLSQRVQAPGLTRGILALAVAWCLAVLAIRDITRSALLTAILPNFIYAPALAAVLVCCCLADTWLSRALSSRALLAMGTISYSVYVWSFFVLAWLHPNFVSSAPSTLAYLNSTVGAAICMGLTTILAFGSYHLIEAPSRRWIRGLARTTARRPATGRDAAAQPLARSSGASSP